MIKQTIFLLTIVCLCWGCAVKKEKRTIEHEVQSVEWHNRDSLWWESQLEMNERRVINMQQYKFSRPDSCGIQYIEYLTQAEICDHTEAKEITLTKAETVTSSQEQYTQYIEKQTESKTSSAGWHYRLIGITLSLCLLFYLHKRKK